MSQKEKDESPQYESCSVTVAVRCRPMNEREKLLGAASCTQFFPNNSMKILAPKDQGHNAVHPFTFDHCYAEDVAQDTIFDDIGRPVLDATYTGFNTCIFAYGQTGSGKSHTMMGPAGGRDFTVDPGIIPRLCTTLFEEIQSREQDCARKLKEMEAAGSPLNDRPPVLKHIVQLTYLEIYQERVKCLLNPSRDNLRVRQHPKLGVFVEGLTHIAVNSYPEVLEYIEGGNNVRHVASTQMNERSSRSHAIFTLVVTQRRTFQTRLGENVNERVARVNLVDLAGSERVKSTGAEGDTLREGANINKSLSTLGLVISGLAEASKPGGKKPHIPFRDSQLTWLLKENLGGNSKTYMLSAISPADVHYDESLSTLRYADRAKSIVTKACINEDPKTKLIRELREELALYKKKVLEYEARKMQGGRPAPEAVEAKPPPSPSSSKGPMVPRLNIGRVTGVRTSVSRPTTTSPIPGLSPKYSDHGEDDWYCSTPHQPGEEEAFQEEAAMVEAALTEMLMTDEDFDRQQAFEREQRAEVMKRLANTVKVERDEPYLLNLENCGDWVMEYLVDEVTYVGSKPLVGAGPGARGILVEQDDVQPRHCCFLRNPNGSVTLRPFIEAETYVDDGEDPIKSDYLLTPNQTIQLGEYANIKFCDKNAPLMSSRRQRLSMRATLPIGSSPVQPQPIRPTVPKLALSNLTSTPERKTSTNEGTSTGERPQRAAPMAIRTPRGVTASSAQFLSSPPEPLVTVHRHTYVLLGNNHSGKSTLRACMVKPEGSGLFSLPWLSKKLPETVPTLGFESSTVTAGSQTKISVTFLEISGLDCFAHLYGLIPEQRVTFILCWRLIDQADLQVFRKYLEVIQGRAPSRETEIILVGTCRDLVPTKDTEILQNLADLSAHLSTYLAFNETTDARRPKIVNRFAVSCKERTVIGPSSSIKKMTDLIAYFGDYGILRTRADIEFPNAMIPQRVLSLEAKLKELRIQGKWILPSQEYKVFARVVDARYDRSVEELHRHTQLLSSWGQLNHQFRHMFIKKYVVLDVAWVFRVITTLCCCIPPQTHYIESSEMNRFDACTMLPVDGPDRVEFRPPSAFTVPPVFPAAIFAFGPQLPFDIQEVRKKDPYSLLCRGILTVGTAEALFRTLLGEKAMDLNDIGRIFDLLEKYDLLMPGSKILAKRLDNTSFHKAIPRAGSHEGGEMQDDDAFKDPTGPAEDFFLIPSCFNTLVPTAVTVNLMAVLHGPTFRFSFNIVPPFFFPRLVSRIAIYCKKVYVGPVTTSAQLTGQDTPIIQSASFWCNCVWVVSTDVSRALIRTVQRSLFVTFHDPQQDDEFRNGVREAMRSVIGESPGVRYEETIKCETCDNWLVASTHHSGGESPVLCSSCGLSPSKRQEFDPAAFVEMVLKDAFVMDSTKSRLERCAKQIARGRAMSNRDRGDLIEGRGIDSLVDTLASF